MTLTALPAPSVPPRVPRWTKVTLVVLAALLVPCGAFAMWLVLAFSGGLDDLVDGYEPQPGDAHVVEARDRGEQHVAAELADVVPVASTVLGGSRQLGKAADDHCVFGQNNFKYDDGFDLYCTHGQAVVLDGDPTRFREDALALHAALEAGGWTAENSYPDVAAGGIAAVVSEYWDARAEFASPGYSPADLPSADYVRGTSRLLVQWVEPGTITSTGYPLYEAEWESTPAGRTVGPDHAGLLVPVGGYGTVLVVSTEYFRD